MPRQEIRSRHQPQWPPTLAIPTQIYTKSSSINGIGFVEQTETRDWLELIGGRLMRIRRDRATIHHDLAYDARMIDLLRLI